jgi:hypothetical protein
MSLKSTNGYFSFLSIIIKNTNAITPMIRNGKIFDEELALDGRLSLLLALPLAMLAACRLLPDVSRSVRTNRNEVTVIANAIAPLISI